MRGVYERVASAVNRFAERASSIATRRAALQALCAERDEATVTRDARRRRPVKIGVYSDLVRSAIAQTAARRRT